MSIKRPLLGLAVFCLFLAAAVLSAAGTVAFPAKKNIVISLERKEIRDLDSSGLILVFFLDIANSEETTYSLIEYDYRVVVEGSDYFALRTGLEPAIPVEADKTTRISLPLKITYADLLERVPGVAGLPKASCYVTGLLVFSDSRGRQEKIPFAFSGDFPFFQDLEVEVKPLAVKTLTIGGSEFTLSFSLRNANSFELTLGKLAYKFEVEGHIVASGNISAGQKIESQAEVIFSLPLMLDFFEAGREVFDIFQKPSAASLLSGDSRFDSVWGEFKLSFAKQGDIQIIRAE